MELQKKFALAILSLRTKNEVKITQRDIADEADMNIRYYQSLEADEKMPSLKTVEKIAKAFDMKLSELCKIIEEMD